MNDYSGKRPLHLGCGEGLCSYLGASANDLAKLADMRPSAAAPSRRSAENGLGDRDSTSGKRDLNAEKVEP